MMAYLESSKIKIFPFGSARSADPNSRLLNESNLVRLIKSFVDSDSYVISYDENTKYCVFVIGGYYCECDLTDVVSTDKDLYAFIKLDKTDNNQYILSGNDDSNNAEYQGINVFTGVTFKNDKPTDADVFLHILGSNGTVPLSSYKKFNYSSVQNNYTTIDCGSATTVL